MGFIPTTFTPMGDGGIKHANLPVPAGGANFRSDWKSTDASKCVSMKNMVPCDTGIRSRGSFEQMLNELEEGTFHSMTSRTYCEKHFIHFGNKLYSISHDSSQWQLVYEGVPDKSSMFCEFASKLYLYSDTYVYSIDRDFNCVEEFPKVPLVVTGVDPEHGNLGTMVQDYWVNLIAPVIAVEYRAFSGWQITLPYKRDTTRKIRAFSGDEEIGVSIDRCTDYQVYFDKLQEYAVIRLEYYLAQPEDIKYDSFFSGCTCCVAYGGSDAGGTRVFAGGNSERTGEYCKSELIDPLCFKMSSIEKLGDGSDGITGFIKMYDNLLILTDRSVYRMNYKLTDSGGFFNVCQINSQIGCDMPHSVQLIANRAVFANSRLGVHMVYYADETGEMNVVPVSGNINTGEGGLLCNSRESLKNAQSLDYDSKYFLCVGSKVYVWDYGMCGFIRSGSYENSQGRLVWFLWDEIDSDILFSMEEGLYSLKKDGGIVGRYNAEKSSNQCFFVTEQYDFGNAMKKKSVTHIKLDLKMSKGTEIVLTLYSDAKPYYSQSIYCGKDSSECLDIKLPEMPLYRFSYGLGTTGGFFQLSSASASLKLCAE